MKWFAPAFAGLVAASLCLTADAAWILEIDTDGSTADGAGGVELITFNPNFGFGGDTTAIGGDSGASPAVGMTGGDSIFSGNGALQPDTYTYRYTPAVDGDNLVLTAGTALNDNGNVAGGGTAGGSGLYTVYATWPRTTNVTGGPTRYTLSDAGGTLFTVDLNQNTVLDNSFPGPPAPLGGGGEWVPLGTAVLNAATTYTLTQSVTVSNSFVSMRAAGVLFDPVVIPEPATMTLIGLALAGCLAVRRRAA